MAQTVILNMIPKGIPDAVYVSQYDAGRELIFKLYEGVSVYTIPAGASVVIGGKKGDNHTFAYTATIAQDRHSVSVETTEQMTAYAGENLCQLRISKSGIDIATVNFRMIVQERPDASGDPSETDIPALVELAQQQVYDAEAWAKGTKNGTAVPATDPQYNNYAKYWADIAEQWASQFTDGVVYKGSVLFANIPTTGMLNGWMYNITDSFTTDSRFSEGTGIYCEAGTNIIWSDDASKWDLAGGFGGVQSFNGRHGNITPAANDYDATQIKFGTNSNVNTELGNKADNTTSFTEASTRANIASGETIPTILGKIKKWFSDLKDLAFVAIDGASSTKYLRGDGTWQALGTAAAKNVPTSGDAATTEVVMGNDSRLTDARTPTAHTHNYAGSASAGGAANSVQYGLNINDGSGTIITYRGNVDKTINKVNMIKRVYSIDWTSTVDADGYYTNTINLSQWINTYVIPFISCCGVNKDTLPTAEQKAAFNLCDVFYFADGQKVGEMTIKAKTKPTVDFYILISGEYYA